MGVEGKGCIGGVGVKFVLMDLEDKACIGGCGLDKACIGGC